MDLLTSPWSAIGAGVPVLRVLDLCLNYPFTAGSLVDRRPDDESGSLGPLMDSNGRLLQCLVAAFDGKSP